MKRMKFLNGISAMLALVGVAIATTFTSCEKEDFNVNIEPINAQATIEPTVLYVDETGTKNVTEEATVTSSTGSFTFTGSPTLSAQTVTLTAEYNGIPSAPVNVEIPALSAGQYLTMSVTLIVQKDAPAPVNAKAEVKPIVYLSANGTLTDITKDATITFDNPDGDGVFEGDAANGGILEATTCKVTATYGELDPQTITVDIPRLLAGMSVTLNPVIILTQMPEEAPAIAEIKPIVLHMTPTAVVDVTDEATITYAPDEDGVFEGTPNLTATTATVTASYEGLTNTVTVNVPALEAGQYTTLTPTIILMDAVEEPVITVVSNVTGSTEVVGSESKYEDNVSDYWYNTTVTYTEKIGNDVEDTKLQTTDPEEVDFINSFAEALNTYAENRVEKEVPVYSHSRTNVTISYLATEVTYSFYRVLTLQPQTKAAGQELVGSVVVKEYRTTFVPQLNQQIPGHGHAPAYEGHGHSHGHGGENAGGGIVFAD